MAPVAPAPTPVPGTREALHHLARLLRLVRGYWGALATSFGLGLALSLVGLVLPYLSKLYIDEVYPARDVALMHVLVVGLVVVSVANSIMGAVSAFYAQSITARMGSAVGLFFFNHLQHLPTRFYDEHQVGEVMSRAGDVRGGVGAAIGMVQSVVSSVIYLALVPPLLFLLDWRLALLSLATIPVNTLVATLAGRVTRRYWKLSAEASAELSALQVEGLTNIRTMKTLAVEHFLYRRNADKLRAALEAQFRATGIGMVVGFFTGAIGTLGTAAYSWFAWTLILRGELTLGSFIVFSAYLGYLTGPVGALAGLVAQFQQVSVTLGRAFEYIDAPVEQDPGLAYRPPPPVARARGELVARHVSFGYAADREVLHDVSLALRPGTVTAVVGPSGAGKSSLLRVLCRLEEPTRGVVTLDGVPLGAIPLADFRRQVAVAWQEVALLRGSIWENLTYGIDPATPGLAERVREATRACQLDALLAELPAGLDTPVAEWGATLSGGQRQRMAVARALVRPAPVLVLDEATSQVDVSTEEALLRALFAATRDRAVLFVTHRVGTAALADQVCVLDGGRVVGIGSAHELAAGCEPYRELLRAAGLLPALPAPGDASPVVPLKVFGGVA